MNDTHHIQFGLLTHDADNQYSVDASEIGLEPGQWPTTLRIHDEHRDGRKIGVAMQVGSVTDHGELTGVVYYCSEWAIRLTVWND